MKFRFPAQTAMVTEGVRFAESVVACVVVEWGCMCGGRVGLGVWY